MVRRSLGGGSRPAPGVWLQLPWGGPGPTSETHSVPAPGRGGCGQPFPQRITLILLLAPSVEDEQGAGSPEGDRGRGRRDQSPGVCPGHSVRWAHHPPWNPDPTSSPSLPPPLLPPVAPLSQRQPRGLLQSSLHAAPPPRTEKRKCCPPPGGHPASGGSPCPPSCSGHAPSRLPSLLWAQGWPLTGLGGT